MCSVQFRGGWCDGQRSVKSKGVAAVGELFPPGADLIDVPNDDEVVAVATLSEGEFVDEAFGLAADLPLSSLEVECFEEAGLFGV